MTPRLVHVEWEDAASIDGWGKTADFEMSAAMCVTVGFVIAEDSERIAVASTTGEDDACCIMVIPRGMIVRISAVTKGEELALP